MIKGIDKEFTVMIFAASLVLSIVTLSACAAIDGRRDLEKVNDDGRH